MIVNTLFLGIASFDSLVHKLFVEHSLLQWITTKVYMQNPLIKPSTLIDAVYLLMQALGLLIPSTRCTQLRSLGSLAVIHDKRL